MEIVKSVEAVSGKDCYPVREDFFAVDGYDYLGGRYEGKEFSTKEEAEAFLATCTDDDFARPYYAYGSAGFEEASLYDDDERAHYGY